MPHVLQRNEEREPGVHPGALVPSPGASPVLAADFPFSLQAILNMFLPDPPFGLSFLEMNFSQLYPTES